MLPLGVCPQECPVCVLQLWALPRFTSCMLPQAQARASQEVTPAVLWAWDGFNHLIERPLETEAQGGLISVPVEPASSPGLWALCHAPSLGWQEEAFLTKATRLPLARGDEWRRWSAGPPPPVSEKRGNTRLWGIPPAPRPWATSSGHSRFLCHLF